MSAAGLSWEVELPARRSCAMGPSRPRAHLLIESEARGSERIAIPVAVGRRLAAEDGEPAPSSRAELLYRVGEISRHCAHARMEDLVGRRDLSCAELAERLSADGYHPDVVEGIVRRARETGVVDDARYAAAFIASKVACGWGRIRIERELSRRGIDAADVEGWPDEFLSADDERERALALASRRRLTGKNDYQKIARFLCSRGFAASLACSVAREVLSDDAS